MGRGKGCTLRYDPGITSVMPMAGGCLTKKRRKRCLAVFTRCLVVFVDFFHFLLLLVTIFTGRKFCKLLFTRFRGKVCYFLLLFLLLITMINYFLLGQGNYWVSLCKGGI
jgi:hypothetical protein